MNIKDETLQAMAKAIRAAINVWATDEDIAEAALQAFADHAALDDLDELQKATLAGR
jgi:hypothetical protein